MAANQFAIPTGFEPPRGCHTRFGHRGGTTPLPDTRHQGTAPGTPSKPRNQKQKQWAALKKELMALSWFELGEFGLGLAMAWDNQ